jgi:hypothetical protein
MESNPNGNIEEITSQGDLEATTDMPSEETTKTEEAKLPENVTDRTRKEFDKLLKMNKELASRVKELETTKPEFKSEVSASDMGDYIDEDGNVDIAKLNADLKAIRNQSLEARALAEDAKTTIELERALSKHPYLDPSNSDYDQNFNELVKDRIARLKLEGKNASLSQVADEVLKIYRPMNFETKQTEQALEEYKKTQVAKAVQGTVSGGRNIRTEETVENLRQKMYSKDEQTRLSALAERMKRAGL